MSYLMETLISYNDIIGDQAIRNKSTLHWRDNFGQYMFKPISYCLNNNPINNIAKTNRPKIGNFPRLPLFWN